MSDTTVQTWPGLAFELFDMLTGRRAEISYFLDNMEVSVPSHAEAPGTATTITRYAVWKFNGALRISSRILPDK
jgi:hypothetical protein